MSRSAQQNRGHMQEEEKRAAPQGDHERPVQVGGDLSAVASTSGLRGEPGCAHAQEAESPEQHRKHRRAKGHAADQRGVVELPHDCGVRDANQRHGRI